LILLTGGSGFLGQAVSTYLPEANSLSSSDLDLTDGSAVSDAVSSWKPEVVVHLAARVGGITANIANQADFLVDNLRIDANLLSALRSNPPRHLISMLSTCMYPDQMPADQYPMPEDVIENGPPPPTNAAYAAAKRALWRGTLALHEQYEVPFTALIPANLYGPGDHFGEEASHFLAAAIDKIERARIHRDTKVSFFGTGVALRQYVLSTDLARLVALLVERGPLNETLNVAPNHNLSIRELTRAIRKAVDYAGEISFTGKGPDGQLRKDVSAAKLLTMVPEWRDMETPLSEGLEATVGWYRSHVEPR